MCKPARKSHWQQGNCRDGTQGRMQRLSGNKRVLVRDSLEGITFVSVVNIPSLGQVRVAVSL